MSKPKGVARAAKEQRRLDAEERNAATRPSRRRVERDGAVEYRPKPVPAPPVPAAAPAVAVKPRARRVELGRVVDEVTVHPEHAKARRRARYGRVTAPAGQPRTRPSDVAPRRIGDGTKPGHAARAVSIGAVFPVAAKTEPVPVDGHVVGQQEADQ